MAHVEPAHLVELALGNAAPDGQLADAMRHIEQCDHCRHELRMMTRVVTAARSANVVDLPTDPPERVWRRIARDLSSRETAALRPPAGTLGPGKRKILAALALAAIIAAAAAHWCRRDHRKLHGSGVSPTRGSARGV
ncbi:hypothetical protein [Streptomyces djakartensis]|uniref:Zinc-finger domain-containing protein n=1 Tax=Streptomyces djakartensis TaxID=68193 RepID=A0ABQ2Z0J7_9ACTN|nr:hypothetical protein [Streptomyces djakartensis]GGY01198.1 hypothetical protein GCM10010384_00870 [Streptomyces djakartensis]